MIWHGVWRHGFDLFMKHKLKTSKNLINYEVSLFFFSSERFPKNMKSELEISLDNEVLDSLSMETPQTPAACQGETEVSLSNLDKVWKEKCHFYTAPFLSSLMNINSFREHAISLYLSRIQACLCLLLLPVLKHARRQHASWIAH